MRRKDAWVCFLSLACVQRAVATPEPVLVQIDCESVARVQGKIMACSDNSQAVRSAQRCYERLMGEWKNAS